MHYEEAQLLRTPGTFSAPANRTLTAGRPALRGHPTRTSYQAALQAGAKKEHLMKKRYAIALRGRHSEYITRERWSVLVKAAGGSNDSAPCSQGERPSCLSLASNSAQHSGNHSSSFTTP